MYHCTSIIIDIVAKAVVNVQLLFEQAARAIVLPSSARTEFLTLELPASGMY